MIEYFQAEKATMNECKINLSLFVEYLIPSCHKKTANLYV